MIAICITHQIVSINFNILWLIKNKSLDYKNCVLLNPFTENTLIFFNEYCQINVAFFNEPYCLMISKLYNYMISCQKQ